MAKFKKIKITFSIDESELKQIHPQKRIRQKIIDGLRSGDYEQITSEMCILDQPGTACCLHVAAMCADGVKWEAGIYSGNDTYGTPQSMFRDMLGFNEAMKKVSVRMENAHVNKIIRGLDGVERKNQASFIELNDSYRLSFDDIANILDGKEITKYLSPKDVGT